MRISGEDKPQTGREPPGELAPAPTQEAQGRAEWHSCRLLVPAGILQGKKRILSLLELLSRHGGPGSSQRASQ